MAWEDEWKHLDARIDGLARAAETLAFTLSARPNDLFGVIKDVLVPSSERLFRDLGEFVRANRQDIPKRAAEVLIAFLGRFGNHFSGQIAENLSALQLILSVRGLAAELNHYFADYEIHTRHLVERAFLHLQRSLAIDVDLRKRWKSASEEKCEKLGALHLLSHGLWAFKAHATGARTDLVIGEPLDESDGRLRDVEALVLTEWKLASSRDVAAKADEAYLQAHSYRTGVLAGFQLTSRRYLVLVSEDELKMPPDKEESGVIYRHVNIARNPSTPSVNARRLSSGSAGPGS